MRKVQQGFTLIELLIVIAIIGILAAIAIPSYQKYTKKAKFSEVVQASSPFKLAVEACYNDYGGLASCGTPSTNGIPPDASANGKYVAGVTTTAGGVITATGSTTHFAATENTFILTPLPGTGGNLLDWSKSGSCVAAGLC